MRDLFSSPILQSYFLTPQDEVLTELLSKQQELRELVGYNKQQLQLLYDTAVEVGTHSTHTVHT